MLRLLSDLEISIDFFSYFSSFSKVLSDPAENLLCVSAWNDNGMKGYVSDPRKVLRSDFFPGLGWMIDKSIWSELSVKWPRGYWDDWLREPGQRKGREIIRPEICRTYHYGKTGGTSGNAYNEYLDNIKLNDVDVDWEGYDMGKIAKGKYDHALKVGIKMAVSTSPEECREIMRTPGSDLVVTYDGLSGSRASFEGVARTIGVMGNVKAGVPRGAYKGIVEVNFKGGRKVFIVGKNWEDAI